ncbi:ATP synthase F1 subunit delta [Daejeonella lutea]|uniref:ATP synthase subunit delta n=1 Tax=Daejeonella lutea TaxID=572036 RepID=A0A1T5CYY3_9SPHI|nr:ATP synthase F1 subunit delta [Daejeonella lutea]SKB64682.1 F-type H+-transporting ATPase subunit delta [Daejeonella lutea]
MSEIQVATRYAKSLIDLAGEQNAVETIKKDIELFLETCRANPELQAILKNPIISLDKKANILDGLFSGKVHEMILSFFKIVIRKGRSEILFATAKEFISQYNILKNVVKATVTSASPLSQENIKQIEDVVKQSTKGEVILTSIVDPKLIGGFILKVGDKQFDTSISSKLNKLRKEFTQN